MLRADSIYRHYVEIYGADAVGKLKRIFPFIY